MTRGMRHMAKAMLRVTMTHVLVQQSLFGSKMAGVCFLNQGVRGELYVRIGVGKRVIAVKRENRSEAPINEAYII